MNDEDLIRAMARLDDAIKALESRLPAALAPALPPSTDDDWQQRHAGLAARHDALRDRTAAAVDRLTRLLESAKEA